MYQLNFRDDTWLSALFLHLSLGSYAPSGQETVHSSTYHPSNPVDTQFVLLLRRSAFGIFLQKYHRLSLCSVGILSENRCSACGREKFVLRIVSGYIIELYSLWLPDNFSMPYLLQQTVVLGVCSGVGYG